MTDTAKVEFGRSLTNQEVVDLFPGALDQLKVQRKDPFHGQWVKISGLGEGGWLFGVRDGKLTLFNSVFHGAVMSLTETYSTVYVWNGKEWI